ncbi:hypothetical protein VB834_17140 [Limnoraphis robusta Tam1]|uniref:hypothetical protein n=1 Tax=Limnoraphis robusta TaxID=1118279 RepID=UPI002B204C5D|nr:hypothetical protein [Limnoraphis robusta]MEA5540747.1 hypothetical protein [Limnoraphis robusta Tam1]
MNILAFLNSLPEDVRESWQKEWQERAASLGETISVSQAAFARDLIEADLANVLLPEQPELQEHDQNVLAFLQAQGAPADMIAIQAIRTSSLDRNQSRVGSDVDLDGLLESWISLEEMKVRHAIYLKLITTAAALTSS